MSRRSKYVAAVGLLVATAIGLVTALSPFASEGDGDLSAEVAFTFQDEAIAESSGLVVRGDLAYTINDSGDGPIVYAVDRRTGETAGVTTFDEEDPEDLEAIAPGRGRSLWVGDTGDNRRARGSVRVHRFVPPAGGGTVESETFDLAYPDGPHDAETVLVHPRTGRLLLVSKRPIVGGVVYRAPRELRAGELHRLQPLATVSGMVTDGTFFPDGRHVLLRTAGGAAVYTYPGFDRVTEFELPVQDQGEGVAVGEDGRMYLSSEGELSDVLVMDLPPLSEDETGPAPSAAPADEDAGEEEAGDRTGLGRPRGYLLAALLGSVVVGWLVRASRRRSRRRR